MIKDTFVVAGHKCFATDYEQHTLSITLVDAMPILQAECAASMIAKLFESSEGVELKRIEKSNKYHSKILGVSRKELQQWLEQNG